MNEKPSFMGKLVIKCILECKTGLRVGGSNERIEIGGQDNPVIKDPLTNRPYIPGSSLKGKLRSLLEWRSKAVVPERKKDKWTAPTHQCISATCAVCQLFGTDSKDEHQINREKPAPTRLTVRDAVLNETCVSDLEKVLGKDIYTEDKVENAIDRLTSAASPRHVERVPAGAKFDCEFVVDIYYPEDVAFVTNDLKGAFELLEDSSLGGGGSRGSGQVKFKEWKFTWKSKEHYMGAASPKTCEQWDEIPGLIP